MALDNSWEENIYSKGEQLNRYPYGDLVSIFFRALTLLGEIKNKNDIKVLEVGCGAGNNLWFFAELGFDVYGIDGSPTACKEAKQALKNRNAQATIINNDFSTIDFEEQYFDIIIDREAISSNSFSDIKRISNEINRVLKPNGIMISMLYSDDNQDFLKIKSGEYNAKKVDYNSYTDISNGSFFNQGVKFFATQQDMEEIFNFCNIKLLNKSSNQTIINSINSSYEQVEWIMIGQKIKN